MADYAGDVSAEEAWKAIQADPDAVLVDVRTQPEWAFVGLPDLSGAGKQPLLVQWQAYPSMQVNPQFAQQVEAAGGAPGKKLYFICRSGARSRSAAIAMTQAGFGQCFNVAGGFEGGHDAARHRGAREGWKASGLPWVQD
jgi:rhodanese-related sulfurtransferase